MHACMSGPASSETALDTHACILLEGQSIVDYPLSGGCERSHIAVDFLSSHLESSCSCSLIRVLRWDESEQLEGSGMHGLSRVHGRMNKGYLVSVLCHEFLHPSLPNGLQGCIISLHASPKL